jgi:uncharacterized protein YceH (UPF0502 family)
MKYRHLFDEALDLSDAEAALLCVLMLRGPQTPGELKSRTERLHTFAGTGEVEETLEALAGRGFVARLPRRPGQREDRFEQRLGGEGEEAPEAEPAPPAPAPRPALEERVARLEREVAELRARLSE